MSYLRGVLIMEENTGKSVGVRADGMDFEGLVDNVNVESNIVTLKRTGPTGTTWWEIDIKRIVAVRRTEY